MRTRENFGASLMSGICGLAVGILLGARGGVAAADPSELAEGTRALYRGEYSRAASLAASFIKAHPEASAGFILLARAEIAQGQYEPAYENLRRALRLAPTSVDALYYLGRVALILAQAQYGELYHLAPDSARVHQLLAESYQVQENTAKAEEEYQAALKLNPRSVEVLDVLGDLERSQFHFDSALSYYSRAAEIEPRDYASAYGLGAAYLYRQEPQRAIECLRRALDLDPNSAAAHLALGDALLRDKQPAVAVSELKAAVGLEPEMRQAYTLLAQAYEKLGQPRQAEEALKKAKDLTEREIESRESTLLADPDQDGAAPPSPDGAGEANPEH